MRTKLPLSMIGLALVVPYVGTAAAQGVPTFDLRLFAERQAIVQQTDQDLALQQDLAITTAYALMKFGTHGTTFPLATHATSINTVSISVSAQDAVSTGGVVPPRKNARPHYLHETMLVALGMRLQPIKALQEPHLIGRNQRKQQRPPHDLRRQSLNQTGPPTQGRLSLQ